MKQFITVLFITFIFSSCSGRVDKETYPDNKNISYSGRYCFTENGDAVSDWPGTYFRCIFTGRKLGLRLEGESDVMFNVFVDKMPVMVVACNNGDITWIAQDLKAGKHTLEVFKRTESLVGRAVFKGIVTEHNSRILPWKGAPERRIEFIGNSITCGYGVEGASRRERFKAETENNYLTYAALLARTFNADYSVIAHSGLGVVRHYGDSLKVSTDPQMPSRYLRTLDTTDSLKWNFSSWKPTMVMINLGTNDFSTKPYPDKDVFQAEYEKLIQTIRNNYGNIPVFCVSGPLIGDPCSSYVKEVTERIKSNDPASAIFFIGIPRDLLSVDEDFGSDEHPSITGQRKIAETIAPVISKELGWSYDKVSQ